MSYPVVPLQGPNNDQLIRQIAEALNRTIGGRMNVTGDVTLNDGATTTTLTDSRIRVGCVLALTPRTANAATALQSVYIPEHGNGELVINHASSGNTDQDFRYAIIG